MSFSLTGSTVTRVAVNDDVTLRVYASGSATVSDTHTASVAAGGAFEFNLSDGVTDAWPSPARLELHAEASGKETVFDLGIFERALPVSFSEPLNWATFTGSSQTFTWSWSITPRKIDIVIDDNPFVDGVARTSGLTDSVGLQATDSTWTATGLPVDGRPLYVRVTWPDETNVWPANAQDTVDAGRVLNFVGLTAFTSAGGEQGLGITRSGMTILGLPQQAYARGQRTWAQWSALWAQWTGLEVLGLVDDYHPTGDTIEIQQGGNMRQWMRASAGQSTRFEVRLNLQDARTYRLSQRIRFEEGFSFRKGGKCGFGLRSDVDSSGGNPVPNGWSVRISWGRDGGQEGDPPKLEVYIYDNDTGGFGRAPVLLNPIQDDTDYWIDLEVTVNSSLAASDGSMRVWVNGNLEHSETGTKFQSEGNDPPLVQQLRYIAFHGGNDASWEPLNDSFLICSDVAYGIGPYPV